MYTGANQSRVSIIQNKWDTKLCRSPCWYYTLKRNTLHDSSETNGHVQEWYTVISNLNSDSRVVQECTFSKWTMVRITTGECIKIRMRHRGETQDRRAWQWQHDGMVTNRRYRRRRRQWRRKGRPNKPHVDWVEMIGIIAILCLIHDPRSLDIWKPGTMTLSLL